MHFNNDPITVSYWQANVEKCKNNSSKFQLENRKKRKRLFFPFSRLEAWFIFYLALIPLLSVPKRKKENKFQLYAKNAHIWNVRLKE